MNQTKEELDLFYKQLGMVFYAIASADKSIALEEEEKLQQMVAKLWIPFAVLRNNEQGLSARHIEKMFNILSENMPNAREALFTFSAFKNAHPAIFTNDTKELIWRTAVAIADAFSAKNKSELVMLSELGMILKK